jgi:PPOX class probable F420-dependent enzyme
VKRIHNNPAVEIAPSTHLGQPRGPVIRASARILSALEQHVAEQAMYTKYGWQKQFSR